MNEHAHLCRGGRAVCLHFQAGCPTLAGGAEVVCKWSLTFSVSIRLLQAVQCLQTRIFSLLSEAEVPRCHSGGQESSRGSCSGGTPPGHVPASCHTLLCHVQHTQALESEKSEGNNFLYPRRLLIRA